MASPEEAASRPGSYGPAAGGEAGEAADGERVGVGLGGESKAKTATSKGRWGGGKVEAWGWGCGGWMDGWMISK